MLPGIAMRLALEYANNGPNWQATRADYHSFMLRKAHQSSTSLIFCIPVKTVRLDEPFSGFMSLFLQPQAALSTGRGTPGGRLFGSGLNGEMQ
jgi:hypothetical protein